MRILVIGGGGREHALAWKLTQSTLRNQVYCTPGNPGIAEVARCLPAKGIADYLKIANAIDAELTIAGPEVPLVEGVVDLFRAGGRLILGPTQKAARLEGSKQFSKELMQRLGIPTARYRSASTRAEALVALDEFSYPVVLKADGLAAGKGVIIARDRAQAESAVNSLPPGALVIEEFLEGEEVSFIALCDGRAAVPLETTQDHKAAGDGDTGPNTGGMGAYCDGRLLSAQQVEHIMSSVIGPVVEATGFSGFLYAGLMLTVSGPKVLEFNCRLGDPETQPLMHRMHTDPTEIFHAAANGSLGPARFEWRQQPSVCVVMAAEGYPGKVTTGDSITGVRHASIMDAEVFQAGTRLGPMGLETSGGRVLGVTASGPTLAQAIERTYAAVRKIQFRGMHYRTDIGRKGLRRWM